MYELTPPQQEAFDFIKSFIEQNGYAPTLQEIGAMQGITPQGAKRHLNALEKKGKIELKAAKHRKITVIEEN
ncbi:winged helix-turn-helix transcriptional regulator [Lentisphaerota bacterium WC36G]|nr:winged helix-turn-helix transcriptional regulator [Lentisphaerae bacterium WC36]